VILGLVVCLAAGARAETVADSTRAEASDLPPPSAQAWQAVALAPDKLQHFSLAFSLGLAFGIMTGEPAAASGAAALAVAKEVADSRHGSFGKGDLLAGLLGAGCAFFLVGALER
jgi:hypothetical protein